MQNSVICDKIYNVPPKSPIRHITYEKSDFIFMNKFDKKLYLKTIFLILIFTLASGIALAGIYLRGNNLENLLYYARVPLSDGSTLAIKKCIAFCVPTSVIIFLIANIAVFMCILHKETIKKYSEKNRVNFPIAQMHTINSHKIISGVSVLLISIIFFGNQIDAFSYLGGMMKTTSVYEEEYAPPQKQIYQFPEKKKNLIYIFLESMETSYASVEEGGVMADNYIPYLTEMAKENISFSDTDVLGGAQSVAGTTWTAAAMVTQTSGIPLTIPISKSNFGQDNKFLPGAYSIGEILEKEGYTNELLVGSKASFAKRKAYFEQHGNFRVFDYYTAVEREYIPEDYYVWWGYEDRRLFDYAKIELNKLYSEGNPFNLTMLTVDTHFTDGYKCPLCEEIYDSQYANVIHCSDKQIYEFIEWIKQQPFYKDTVIVLSGDHLTMDHHYFDRISETAMKRGRRIYNCFINTGMSADHTKNRTFTTMDMFPTTLASLGVTWGKENLGLGVNLFSGEKTLAEKKGLQKFSDQLASSSDFYSGYIIDKNLNLKSLPKDFEGGVGPSSDMEYANEQTERQHEADSAAEQNGISTGEQTQANEFEDGQ